MHTENPIANDMRKLDALLRETVAPHLRKKRARDMRILNLACGQCDEAETLARGGQAWWS